MLGDVVGTIGVSLLLLAYALNARGVLSPYSYRYLGLNALGALLAGTASALIGFIPFVVLEGVWFLVSLASIVKVYRGHHNINNEHI